MKCYIIFMVCSWFPFSGSGSNWLMKLPRDTSTVADCKKCILLTDINEHRIVIVDIERRKLIWQWKPDESDIPHDKRKWFLNYSDVKPVYGGKYLLISSSAGGVAIIRIADKKAVFLSYAGGNTHSIELLPDGDIVSASSTGNFLMLFRVDTLLSSDTYKSKIYLPAAHNVVWDKKRKLLWAAAQNKLYCFKYNFDCSKPGLLPVDSVYLPDTGAHDLFPMYGKDSLFLTTSKGIYKVDPATKKITALAYPLVKNIKSISSGPEGFPTIIMKPKIKWWSDEVLDLQGNRIYQLEGIEIYKARWFLPNQFSYNNETLKICDSARLK